MSRPHVPSCCSLSPFLSRIAFTLGAVALLALGIGRLTANQDAPKANRVFEMRTYVAHEGKLDDLNKRFRDHTARLFEKHGITNVGYWTPVEGPEAKTTLVYILAYPSLEAREKSWQAFRADPEWQAAQTASEKNGALVSNVISQFLVPTDYSAIK